MGVALGTQGCCKVSPVEVILEMITTSKIRKCVEFCRLHLAAFRKFLQGEALSTEERQAIHATVSAKQRGVLYAITSPLIEAVKVGKCGQRNPRIQLWKRYGSSYGRRMTMKTFETGDIDDAEIEAQRRLMDLHIEDELYQKPGWERILDVLQNVSEEY